jgi:hypothetical protein
LDSKYSDPVKKELTESVIKKWVLAGVFPVKEKYLANTLFFGSKYSLVLTKKAFLEFSLILILKSDLIKSRLLLIFKKEMKMVDLNSSLYKFRLHPFEFTIEVILTSSE